MGNEINLLEMWRVLLKWRLTIAFIVFFLTLSSAVTALLLPKVYKAQAALMPIGGSKNMGLASAITSSAVGGLISNISPVTVVSPQLMAILQSRTLAERMIDKYHLRSVFYPKLWDSKKMEDIIKKLQRYVKFTEDKKSQLIYIYGFTRDSKLSADLVNAYIQELTLYLNENAFTAAKRNRIFIEEQLERNRADILETGKELTSFYSTRKVSNVVSRLDVDVGIGMEEKQLLMVADLKMLGKDLQERVEYMSESLKKTGIVKDVPQQIYLQYMTLRLKLLEQLNGLLSQQYEMAKIEEAKEDLKFEVIDWARVPERKFKPERRKIVMVTFVVSFFLAGLYVFFREYLAKIQTKRQLKA